MDQYTQDLTNETTNQQQPQSTSSAGCTIDTKILVCAVHGEYPGKSTEILGKEFSSECPSCVSIKDSEVNAKEKQRDLTERAIKIKRLSHDAMIPPRFQSKTFDNYSPVGPESAMAHKVCAAYADRFEARLAAGGGMVMCGAPGTGKTHLACAIANSVINNNARAAVFMSVLQAVRSIKETYNKKSERTERQALSELQSPELLILDEVGVQFGSDAEKLILFEIINDRYQHMKPTILISNLALEELKTYIGERIVDRMQEGGGAIVSFNWESYRAHI